MQIGTMNRNRRLTELALEFAGLGACKGSAPSRTNFSALYSRTGLDNRIRQTQLSQRPYGVRPNRQTRADGVHLGRLFINGHVYTGLPQRDSRGQSADTATNDDCPFDQHQSILLNNFVKCGDNVRHVENKTIRWAPRFPERRCG